MNYSFSHPLGTQLSLFFMVILFLFIPQMLTAQEEDDDNTYTREFIYGFNKNTNGGTIGSIFIKWSRMKKDDVYITYGAEISNVKHNKESKMASYETGKRFIVGKSHYLYCIRLQYGRERIVFKKDTQKGVQINLGYMGGPTIGLEAPYYIENTDGKFEPYDYTQHGVSGVAGPGRVFEGLNESKFRPGIHLEGSIAFEFGTFKNNVAGIELGAMVEAFTQKIILMPTLKNRAVFISAFMGIYWGTRR